MMGLLGASGLRTICSRRAYWIDARATESAVVVVVCEKEPRQTGECVIVQFRKAWYFGVLGRVKGGTNAGDIASLGQSIKSTTPTRPTAD